MLTFVVKLQDLSQLETLLLAAKAVGVTPEVGVIPDAVPSRRKSKGAKPSTKKRKGKRTSSKASVRLVANSKLDLTEKEQVVHKALMSEFGTDSFQRSLARAVVAKKLKTPHVSGYISKLQAKGAIAYAG